MYFLEGVALLPHLDERGAAALHGELAEAAGLLGEVALPLAAHFLLELEEVARERFHVQAAL